MNVRTVIVALIAATLFGCNASQDQPADENLSANSAAGTTDAPLSPPAPGEPGGLPDDRTPISEGDLNRNGPEGAGQVLQQYSALVEQGRFAEARALWTDGPREGETELQALYDSAREVHAMIGAPGAIEGAAGSLYVRVPYQLYGRLRDGTEFNRIGTMTLKRVNDVPGSTEEQRRWQIVGAEVR